MVRQPRADWLRKVGQAFLAWVVVGTALAWAARFAFTHPLDPSPWQLAAYCAALVGFLLHLLFLHRKRQAGVQVERVVPRSLMLTAGVTLAFFVIGAPIAFVTGLAIPSPQAPMRFRGLSFDFEVVGHVLEAYERVGIPAALAGLANSAAVLLLAEHLRPIEEGFSIRLRATLGAGAAFFVYAIFSALYWRDQVIEGGIVAWVLPSVVAGALTGMIVNGAASRYVS